MALFYVPYLVAGYPVFILPQYMLFGVLALTLCLLWGFGGMVSFGQGAFFAIGAYAFGITLKHVSGASGPWLGLLLGIVLGAAIAGAVGYFLFSANVRDSYFVLVTLAISTIVYVVANSQSDLTGGFNGMYVDRVTFSLSGVAEISLNGDLAMYYVAFAVTLLCLPWLPLAFSGRRSVASWSASARTRTARGRSASTRRCTRPSPSRSPARWQPWQAASTQPPRASCHRPSAASCSPPASWSGSPSADVATSLARWSAP